MGLPGDWSVLICVWPLVYMGGGYRAMEIDYLLSLLKKLSMSIIIFSMAKITKTIA